MKRILFFPLIVLIIFFLPNVISAQNISINNDGSKPNANAMLDVKAFNKGILIPRTSTTSRTAIPNTKGLLVYDTTINSFYYNDGSAWQQIAKGNSSLSGTTNYIAKFTGSSAAGNSQIFDNGQYVGIGTTTPVAKLQVVDSSVVFSAVGDVPASRHNVPVSGVGRRMMWYPDKAAFRAGYTDNNGWDSANIGLYSTALGYSNTASGKYSFANGIYSSATGSFSFVSGYESGATKDGSVAIGNFVSASGVAAAVFGQESYASGDYSIASGYGSGATGKGSAAFGYASDAGGDYSTALGYFSKATGYASLATGEETNATSDYSTAIGYQTMASSHAAFAAGANTVASYYATTALGSFTTASNFASVAMGDVTTASGYASIAMGSHTTAGGNYSLVWGVNSNTTGSNSFILGNNLFDGGHKGDAMLGDTDPWNAGSVGSGTDDQMICRFNNGYYFITGGNTNRTGVNCCSWR